MILFLILYRLAIKKQIYNCIYKAILKSGKAALGIILNLLQKQSKF